MTLSLGLNAINRVMLRCGLARYKNTLVVIFAGVLAVALTLAILAPASPVNLGQPSHADQVLQLTNSWAKAM